MKPILKYKDYEFFETNCMNADFRALLQVIFRDDLVLKIKHENETVTLEASHNPKKQSIAIQGHWALPHLDDQFTQEVGPLIMAPLFYNIGEIQLPREHLYSTGRHWQTIAEIIVKNIFFAAVRNSRFDYVSVSVADPKKNTRFSKEFRKRYLWTMRNDIKDDALFADKADDVLASLSLKAYIQPEDVNSELIKSGLEEFHNTIRKFSGKSLEAVQMDVMKIRTSIIEQYT